MAISVDAATVARWSGTPANNTNLTSGTFTPPNNSLLVLCFDMDSQSGSVFTGTVSVSGGGLTWTSRAVIKAGDVNSQGGYASVWTAPVTTGASMSVSVQHSNGNGTNRMSCKLYIVTGHDTTTPTGATGTGGGTTNDLTASLFTAQTLGVAFVSAVEWNALGAGTTAPTSSDLTADAATYNLALDVLAGYKTIGSTGSATTADLNAAGTSAAAWGWAAVEVRAAAGGGGGSPAPLLPLLGVGRAGRPVDFRRAIVLVPPLPRLDRADRRGSELTLRV